MNRKISIPKQQRTLWRTIAFSLLLITAFATPLVIPPSPGTVHGKVTDENGKAIGGARVTLVEQGTASRRIVYTDVNGQYLLSNLSLGHFSLQASHSGYTQSAPATFESSTREIQLDIELPSAARRFGLPPQNSLAYFFMTALVPTLLFLFFTRPMQAVTSKLWQFGQKTTYSILAPRFPNRIGIPGYKKRLLRSDLAYIENLVGPPELKVRLERAFAPITVVSESAKTGIDPFAFAATHPRFIMLGGPGTGKTTLMKSLVTNVVKGSVPEELKGMVPVFIVLRDLAQAQHTVEHAVVASLARFGLRRSDSFVEAALSKGRLLIVLDGLDEVGPSRPKVADAIRTFCKSDMITDHPNRVIVTCREMSYRARDLNDVLPVIARVDPFTPQHMRVFLRGWPPYKDRVALRLYGELEKAPPVRESCRNPLLLSILTGLYLQTSSFDLPSSRDEFYETAINELLLNRPARRGLKQDFSERDKWLLLQRLSLHALQVSSLGSDEEKMNRSEIYKRAREVFGDEHNENSFRALLSELVEVNGILKHAEEDSFILGHRTFQEYLAAREARRTLSVDDVLTKFADRPELYEVLSFYAGLLTNIPQLNQLLRNLLKRNKDQLAGRCLLSATEIPDRDVVERVVVILFDAAKLQIAGKGEHLTELEILSFLSQKPDGAFESARVRLTELIELLLGSNAEQGSAGLVSILATREETALKLIPGLLESDSKELRVAGVQLLFSLGTDQALDGLIQLLTSHDQIVKHEAAVLVSHLLQRRGRDILVRTDLLPQRSDLSKWPLERYIPGRLALPIMEGLSMRREVIGSFLDLGNVMEIASRAIVGQMDPDWRNLRRDMFIRDSLAYISRGAILLTFSSSFLLYLMVAVFIGRNLAYTKAAVVSFHPLKLQPYDEVVPFKPFVKLSITIKDTQHRSRGILIRRPDSTIEKLMGFYCFVSVFSFWSFVFRWTKWARNPKNLISRLTRIFSTTHEPPSGKKSFVYKLKGCMTAAILLFPLYVLALYLPSIVSVVLVLNSVGFLVVVMVFFFPSALILVRNRYFAVAEVARDLANEGATTAEYAA